MHLFKIVMFAEIVSFCCPWFYVNWGRRPHPLLLKHVETHQEFRYCCKHFTNKNNMKKDSLESKKSNTHPR